MTGFIRLTARLKSSLSEEDVGLGGFFSEVPPSGTAPPPHPRPPEERGDWRFPLTNIDGELHLKRSDH